MVGERAGVQPAFRAVTRAVVVAVAVAALAGCGTARKVTRPDPTAAATVDVGTCADPQRDGVLGAKPRLRTHERDLNRDGAGELVVSDETMCSAEGNCQWNLFEVGRDRCHVYIGTVAGASLQQLTRTGDRGFADLRAWWRFPGGERYLMQEYRYRRGGYRVVDAVVCRRARGADTLQCADDAAR